ncbi:rRNA-processing protein EBP2 [Cryptococcus gattii E566]|uniref:rRNA processing-related protein, putative n=2 Tax=Cryptococcus gattii TaxID=37769 RepID=E6R4C7_CRYGW|nr:rRNA processing-related protein, putative [Cryptococcus gattii WM276]ADV21927.1 rRNA processing-related protein, putative [Cryptococcus gattii WM276]KIR80852.1 rRNA-processing protein EBP2 [Cryptococcus gattii EJB2]KIY35710.1 rRNA-processing protein EBP2 [Cryptococcus gattii E566]KJE03379.1 rRNA-processing protein EBP2 [Cryptococcus gattii NT-10]
MPISKKDARKLKSNKKVDPSQTENSQSLDKQSYAADEQIESGDEDDQDVSEEGMKRLMELVDVDDLNEYEMALLGAEQDEEDEEGSEDEEVEPASESVDEDEEMQGEDKEQDNTIVNEKPDDDVVSLDGLGSDVSVDEDAVPMQKVTINNKPALRALTDSIRVTSMPWPEHLVLNSKETADVDPSDDLQRETVFYKIALGCIPQARKLTSKHDIPFTRPGDYYAEMVKSDEHMERIRTKLVEEAQGIKKSEDAKKQRELKKFGKQIQHEKLRQREQDKKSFENRVEGLKRKRKEGMELGDEGDEFDIAVEDAVEDQPQKGGRSASGKSKMPRHARDAKFSLGGGGRRSKQNTRESTMDFGGGMSRGKGGKTGTAGNAKPKGRPGKSRRRGGRV